MNHFPIFANLNNRPVLLVGAGHVAERKAESLLQAGARLRVVAQALSPRFQQWLQENRLSWIDHDFSPGQLDSVFLVVSATGDAHVDARVFAAAEAAGRFCNTVDNLQQCSAIMPAVIDRSPVQIAISTAGTSPVLARHWRQQIEALIPRHTGTLAKIAGRWRSRVQARIQGIEARRRFWEQLFASRFDALVADARLHEAETELQRQLAGHTPQRGDVTLVGVGPGDAGLLTLSGLQAMQAADIVFFDAAVSPGIRQQIRKDAERIEVGQPGNGTQATALRQRLVDEARRQRRVVLLKGGTDPFLLERGRELGRVLAAAGVPLRIIPGVYPAPAACPPATSGTDARQASSWAASPASSRPDAAGLTPGRLDAPPAQPHPSRRQPHGPASTPPHDQRVAA
ncbi:MAG: NAD(P)-dependent oxidoreductase [Lautropia sp.]|nr:NAD(P)-dependent oxidoreductase [Lautropia sp.]